MIRSIPYDLLTMMTFLSQWLDGVLFAFYVQYKAPSG